MDIPEELHFKLMSKKKKAIQYVFDTKRRRKTE
jgi:hypothetical protein